MKLPGAIVAYRWLCIWVSVVHVFLILGAIKLTTWTPPPDAPNPEMAKLVPGLAMTLIPLLFLTLFTSLTLGMAKPKPWMWIAGLTHIIGSVLFCPISFLLLLPWYSLEVKRYFDPNAKYLNDDRDTPKR